MPLERRLYIIVREHDSPVEILLIEDGGDNQHPFIKMAGGFIKIMGNPAYFRAYPLKARPGMRGHTWRKLIRKARTVLGNATDPAHPEYRHRIEAHVLDGWGEASRFAQGLGFVHEHTRTAAGAQGEFRGRADVQRGAGHEDGIEVFQQIEDIRRALKIGARR